MKPVGKGLVKASLCDGIPDTIEYDGKCYEFKNTERSYASAQEFWYGNGGILLETIYGGIENFAYETIKITKQQDYVSSKPATIKSGTAITVSDAMKRRTCECEECTSDIVRSLHNKDETARKISSSTSNLKLDRTTLSKYKNTKVILGDKRLSAKVLCFTGGGVIVTSVLIIVVPDLYKLLCYITKSYRRKLKKRRKSKMSIKDNQSSCLWRQM
ncbi:unnamed protein product [Mytilus edulis]|uniref:Uncharacterized protein n=1 Tax=Mytilus edulis TaxID=6550 RepID=A0A8S3QRV3_MYTED|nr:unnamed protein product [Mytilus edulis]